MSNEERSTTQAWRLTLNLQPATSQHLLKLSPNLELGEKIYYKKRKIKINRLFRKI